MEEEILGYIILGITASTIWIGRAWYLGLENKISGWSVTIRMALPFIVIGLYLIL
jgi:hypothetical protein